MKKKLLYTLIVLVFGLWILYFAHMQKNSGPNDVLTISDYKLNTYVSITIYDAQKEYVLKECMTLCDNYELIFSRTNPESELYRLNNGLLPRSEKGYYSISDTLYDIISIGKEYAQLSDNAISIAMEPLISLWNFTDNTGEIPNASEIESVLTLLPSDNILLSAPNQIAFAKNGVPYTGGEPVNYGMGIDLGAIAKGYIADKIKEYLISQDINSAIIYLGGNVLCIGSKPTQNFSPAFGASSGTAESVPFTIGIEKPFDTNGQTEALLKINSTSVVTSGTYQRYFEKDGTIYHHILDSSNGYPYQNNLTSVTIIIPSSTDADALSTTCFALGLEKGLRLLESIENTEGLFITEDGTHYHTSGFSNYLVNETQN